MKRLNNLFPEIVSLENLELADLKARKNKKRHCGIRNHDKNREENIYNLQQQLINGTYVTSRYTTFKVYEPKERIIFRLPYYPDRILHHAIMNVLEPIWCKIFTKDTYSCIKNRGIHACARNLTKDLKRDKEGTKYCLKLDIVKFYPSIDHDILKSILRKKIKDKLLLNLLDSIIDSADGVPIGNYLSQFFANLYLAYFDHWVKEVLHVKYYYRYADDIILLSDSKDKLRYWFKEIQSYLSNNLKLKIKGSYQVFPVDSRGINFVGYVFFHTHTLIRKSIKNKFKKIVNKYYNKKMDYSTFSRKLSSYFGWLKFCNSKHLLSIIQKKIFIQLSNWNGEKSIISNFYDKYIYVIEVVKKNKYSYINFIYNKKPYTVKTRNKRLLFYLNYKVKLPKLIKLRRYVKCRTSNSVY